MGELTVQARGTCPICTAGELGATWTRDLLDGKRTLAEAAERFSCSIDQVWRHVTEHELPEAEKLQMDVRSKLWKCIRIAEDWLAELILAERPNSRTVRQVVSLLAEIRKLLVVSAEMEGSLPVPDVQIVQINNVMQTVVGELCPVCQAKVLKALEVGHE